MIHKVSIYQFRRGGANNDSSRSWLWTGYHRHYRLHLRSPKLFRAKGGPASTATPSRHGSAGGIRHVHPGRIERQSQLTATLQTQMLGQTPSFLGGSTKPHPRPRAAGGVP